MAALIFDIETGTRADAEEFIKPFKAPSNIKDAVKIEMRRRDHKSKKLDSGALNAETCEVLAIGTKQGGGESVLFDTGTEADIIEAWWRLWKHTGTNVPVVGFNCRRFDIPVLVRRSWALGVEVPYDVCTFWRGRIGQSDRIRDLMLEWGCGDHGCTISLGRLARLLGVGGKEDGAGKFYAELRKTDPAAARAYLVNDIDTTYAVAQRMGVCK